MRALVRVLVLATLLATLATAPASAQEVDSVSIHSQAAVSAGFFVDVELRVTCTNPVTAAGVVAVRVVQSPPENWFYADADNAKTVVCDGQVHEVSVHVIGPFDAGRAYATAYLIGPDGEYAFTERWIELRVV